MILPLQIPAPAVILRRRIQAIIGGSTITDAFTVRPTVLYNDGGELDVVDHLDGYTRPNNIRGWLHLAKGSYFVPDSFSTYTFLGQSHGILNTPYPETYIAGYDVQ